MIIGLGIDLIELERIQRSLARFGSAFIDRILHEEERAFLPANRTGQSLRLVEYVAARFAAKEAGAKALGTGIAGGVAMKDIRVIPLASGKPELFLHGKAAEYADALGVTRAHISLSHTKTAAGAVVVLEGDGAPTRQGSRP